MTIPAAPQERLDAVVHAAESAGDPVPARPAPRRALGTRAGRGRAHVSDRDAARAASPARTSSRASCPRCRCSSSTSRLAALYAWQASRRPGPDDLHRRARADAARARDRRDGRAGATRRAVRRSRRSSPTSSHPVWWLGSATAAWAAAKLILVLAMTATVFPAYGLARMVVPKWYALAAAGAAVAVPALAYSPILVEEPLAYPIATLALWLIARTLARPSWGRAAAALAACSRCGTDADAARRSLRRVRARAALARVGVASRQTLALAPGDAGTGSAARSCVVGVAFALLGADGTPLDELARDDRLLQGPDLRARRLGGRRALDRDRGPARARSASPRSPARRASRAHRRRARSSSRASRLSRRSCGTRGSRARTSERLRDRRRRAKRHLPRPDPLRLDGDGARARRRTRVGDRRGGGRSPCSSSRARRSISTSTRTTRRTASRSRPSRTASSAGRKGTIEGALVAACVVALVVVVALKLLRPRSVGFAAVAAQPRPSSSSRGA